MRDQIKHGGYKMKRRVFGDISMRKRNIERLKPFNPSRPSPIKFRPEIKSLGWISHQSLREPIVVQVVHNPIVFSPNCTQQIGGHDVFNDQVAVLLELRNLICRKGHSNIVTMDGHTRSTVMAINCTQINGRNPRKISVKEICGGATDFR